MKSSCHLPSIVSVNHGCLKDCTHFSLQQYFLFLSSPAAHLIVALFATSCFPSLDLELARLIINIYLRLTAIVLFTEHVIVHIPGLPRFPTVAFIYILGQIQIYRDWSQGDNQYSSQINCTALSAKHLIVLLSDTSQLLLLSSLP